MLSALRSALFIAWATLTMVPLALTIVAASLFVRGDALYWICVTWLRCVVWGARVICGVSHRVQGLEHLPAAESL